MTIVRINYVLVRSYYRLPFQNKSVNVHITHTKGERAVSVSVNPTQVKSLNVTNKFMRFFYVGTILLELTRAFHETLVLLFHYSLNQIISRFQTIDKLTQNLEYYV